MNLMRQFGQLNSNSVTKADFSLVVKDLQNRLNSLENIVRTLTEADLTVLEEKVNIINDILSDDMTDLLNKVNELQRLNDKI